MFSESKVNGSDGLRLYYCKNEVTNPKAQLLILHGYTEHCRRYDKVAEEAMSIGFNVIRYDHRGYGRSEGKRAYVNAFQDYIDDLKMIIAQHIDHDLPLFIAGWSMGGLILTSYIIEEGDHHIAGALFFSSALKISEDISPFLQKISGFLSKFFPWLRTIKLDSKHLSRDPEVEKEYLNDPLVYKGGAYARTAGEMLKRTKQVQDQLNKVSCPILVLHGTDDKLADHEGSVKLYKNASSEDKELKLFEGWYHELCNEPENEKVFDIVKLWMSDEKRLIPEMGGPMIADV
jgi:alpha-beta hydrolase superfamily lysophospholipase